MTSVTIERDYEEYVRSCRGNLLRTAWMLTGNWTAAEDVTQTALTSLWKHWSRLGHVDSVEAYAQRVLINAFISARRRGWVREDPSDTVPDVPAPSNEVVIAEQRLVLTRALSRLPARQRAAVVMRYFGDLTEQQTADALNCSLGTVKSQVARALDKLRADESLTSLLEDFQ